MQRFTVFYYIFYQKSFFFFIGKHCFFNPFFSAGACEIFKCSMSSRICSAAYLPTACYLSAAFGFGRPTPPYPSFPSPPASSNAQAFGLTRLFLSAGRSPTFYFLRCFPIVIIVGCTIHCRCTIGHDAEHQHGWQHGSKKTYAVIFLHCHTEFSF